MSSPATLPASAFERAKMLHDLLLARATSQPADDNLYANLRADLLGNPMVAALVPDFVRDSRDLGEFWKAITDRAVSQRSHRRAFAVLCDVRGLCDVGIGLHDARTLNERAADVRGDGGGWSAGRKCSARSVTRGRPSG